MTTAQDIRKAANSDQLSTIRNRDIRNQLNELAKKVEKLEKRDHFLECLEACGVDNWDGYDFAHEMLDEQTK